MKNLKRLLAVLCVLTCIFSLTSCGKKEKTEEFEVADSELVSTVVNFTEYFSTFDEEEMKNFITYLSQSSDETTVEVVQSGYDQFVKVIDEAGDFVGYIQDDAENYEYKASGGKDGRTIVMNLKFEKRDVKAECKFVFEDDILGLESFTFEAQYSLGEKMKKAALNTVMGMGIVVLVLVFLSLLISLFKFVAPLQTAVENIVKKRKNTENQSGTPKDKEAEQIQTGENGQPDETVDDLEVVAAITAAIAAMERTSTDGFVVRSIRRVPNKKWNRGI